jgi:hypothetical protein
MSWWECALWGIAGAFALEAWQFAGAIRRLGGFPWKRDTEPGAAAFCVAAVLRLASSGLIAATIQELGATRVLCFFAGVAAPKLLFETDLPRRLVRRFFSAAALTQQDPVTQQDPATLSQVQAGGGSNGAQVAQLFGESSVRPPVDHVSGSRDAV